MSHEYTIGEHPRANARTIEQKSLIIEDLDLDHPVQDHRSPRLNDIQKKSAGAPTSVSGRFSTTRDTRDIRRTTPPQVVAALCQMLLRDSKDEGSLRRIFMFIKDRSILRSPFEGHHPSFQRGKSNPSLSSNRNNSNYSERILIAGWKKFE